MEGDNINDGVIFINVISLGYFCSVASEMERIGLRTHSGPFDWQACVDFQKRIELINSNFKEFFENLTEKGLYQKTSEPWIYYMKSCGVFLVHDFSMYKPLSEQLPAVRNMYERRVKSFYRQITQKTLFIYYINTEEDASYINNNIDYIKSSLKSYNKGNEILFVSNIDRHLTVSPVYYVRPDKGDTVARKFLDCNDELRNFLVSLPFDETQKRENIKFYRRKRFRKKILTPIIKLTKLINRISKKQYVHSLQVSV